MKLKLFLLVLALQCAWVGYMVVTQERALTGGKVIRLEAHRVDPRDLLRGDYLVLGYEISEVPMNRFSPPLAGTVRTGTKVFVALTPGTNGFYGVSRASATKFAPEPGEVLLAGNCTDSRSWNQPPAVRVAYGIEKYFIREGTGNPPGKLTVQVAVTASGHAVIKQVFADGKPYADALRNQAP